MKQKNILAQFFMFYKRYKGYLFSLALLLIAVTIFFQVTLPQFAAFNQIKKEIEDKKKEVVDLASSVGVVSGLDEEVLSKNLTTARNALPDTKDFIGVFLALEASSARAGVILEDFSLKIGKVYSKKVGEEVKETGASGTLSLSLAINASGSTSQLTTFAQELQKVLPVSEVKKLNISGDNGGFEVEFYYKPYNLVAISSQKKVSGLTQKHEQLLEELKSWGGGLRDEE